MAQAASASADLDIDGWLDHGDSGGGKFLSGDWKDKDGEIKVWLHPKAPIKALWRHPWKVVSSDGKKIRLSRFTSMERPVTLEKQNFREDDGTREYPPELCPFSLLLEWVWQAIEAGSIDWCDPIFKFEAEEEEVIYAGGFTGKFQNSKLTDDEKKEIRKNTGIRLNEAFKQNGRASEQVVFIVIQNDDAAAGPVIAAEGRGLSRAFQKCVKDRRQSMTKEPQKADPLKFPVCFLWKLEEGKGGFKDYTVVATDDDLTDEIKEAMSDDLPSTSKLFEPSNVPLLRQQFEEYWCHEVTPPWDELFEKAMEATKGTPAGKLPGDSETSRAKASDDDEDESEDDKVLPPAKGSKSAPAVASEPEPAPCDACGKPISDDVFENDPVICPHCGAEYEFDETAGEFKVKPKAPPPEEKKADEPAAPRASRRKPGGK